MSSIAINRLKELESMLKQGIITEDEFETIRERIIVKEVDNEKELYFSDVFNSYLIYAEKSILKATLSAYKHKILRFARFLYDVEEDNDLEDKLFDNFSMSTIKDFFEELYKNEKSLSYLNSTKAALNGFCNYLNSIGINAPDIRKIKIDNSFYKKRIRYAYTIDEIYEIASFGNLRENLIIRLIFEGGLKRSQVVNIKRQDLSFDKKQLILYDEVTGLFDRAVELSEETVKMLKTYIDDLYNDIEKWNESRLARGREAREDFGYIFQNIKTPVPQYPVVQTSLKKVAKKYFTSLGFEGDELQDRISEFTTESIKNSRRVFLFSEGMSTSGVMITLGDKNYALCNKSKKLVPILYPEKSHNITV